MTGSQHSRLTAGCPTLSLSTFSFSETLSLVPMPPASFLLSCHYHTVAPRSPSHFHPCWLSYVSPSFPCSIYSFLLHSDPSGEGHFWNGAIFLKNESPGQVLTWSWNWMCPLCPFILKRDPRLYPQFWCERFSLPPVLWDPFPSASSKTWTLLHWLCQYFLSWQNFWLPP